MSWFKRKPSHEERMAVLRAERCEEALRIRNAGPDQPCMSMNEPHYHVKCETGHPAGTPHQHRAVKWGRMTWEYGTGVQNPFEDDWRQANNAAWLKSAPLRDPDGGLPDPAKRTA